MAGLRHEAVPFISYPYEWTFGTLEDAALLHLDLMLAALPAGLILKDASAYNVQWRGAEPVFIDIPSFETLPDGEPWIGYRQFCELFLYPLSCRPIRASTFAPGCAVRSMASPPRPLRRLFSARDLVRPGCSCIWWRRTRCSAAMPAGHRGPQLDRQGRLRPAAHHAQRGGAASRS